MNIVARDPIIVDEEVISEAISRAISEGGTPYEVISMSAYDKSHDGVYDFNNATTRSNQGSDYSSFAPASYDSSYMHPHAQVPSENGSLMTADTYVPHDYSPQNQQYYVSRPEVTSFSPQHGPAGGKLFITLHAGQDFELSAPIITFGSRRCGGIISRTKQPGQYTFAVDIPALDSTSVSSSQVPLYLESNDASGPMSLAFGHFSYTDAAPQHYMTPVSPVMSRKRKLSLDDMQRPEKRVGPPSMRGADFDNLSSSPMSSNALSPYSSHQGQVNYAYSSARTSQFNGSTPRYGVSPQVSSVHLAPPADYPQYIQDRPGVSTSAASYSAGMTGAASSAPPLVRTSTLPDHTGSPHSMASTFNPFAMYSPNSKAILKIDGDLNIMADNWTPDEISTQRRLVRFRRSQVGSTITAVFEPVTLEDHARAPGNIYVNCIWWKEKGACYITSVDTIQLLESLVAVRFTVEEKNRIRRNLEGFRPATVSKTRPECEEFFKTIMGFPSPKPRNIEKDVKVFPWRILGHALKKIIGKYSASYTSGGPAGLAPSMDANASPSPMIMARHSASPHLYSSQTMAPTSMPGPQVTMAPSPVPSSLSQSMSWHQPAPSYATDMSAGRPAWDFGGYVDPNGQGQPMRYERIPSISQSLGYGFGLPQDFHTRSTQA